MKTMCHVAHGRHAAGRRPVDQLRSFVLLVVGGMAAHADASQPPPVDLSKHEPVRYVGTAQPDKRLYDGGLRHAVGVHRYQAYRANRSHPAEGGAIGWTYSHAPMLAHWNGKFYLQYLSNLKEEHRPPARTLIMTSRDGRQWSTPRVAFPVYRLPAIRRPAGHIPAGMPSVMHQRMGFFVAPNGRLLTIGFYSYCATPRHAPNAGNGLGYVVREIGENDAFGPIHFIRYNHQDGWNEENTRYPFFRTSNDPGFVAACDALLADRLVTLQWWEMDRASDGFYAIEPREVTIQFRVMQQQVGSGLMEFEVQDRQGRRPMRLRFDPNWLELDRGKTQPRPVRWGVGTWHDLVVRLDCVGQCYDLAMDGQWVRRGVPFAEPVETVERLLFRTGPWRGDVRGFILDGEPGSPGLYQEDLPGADRKVSLSRYFVDDVKTME